MNSAKKSNKANTSKNLLYKCGLCAKKFSDKRGLAQHSYSHTDETPYQCSLCDYAGKTQQYLTRHIKIKHKRERNFECNVCGKRFQYGSKLKGHMLVHTGEKPYKCTDCDKAFNSSYSLNTHKLIHSNLKPFKCTYCPYACRDSSTLRKHKERHTGQIKYYTCSVCNASCSTKATLKIHIAEMHFEIDMNRMECDYCGKRFKFRHTIVTHIQAVHEKSRTAKCDICGKTLSNRSNLRAHMRTHVDQRPFKCTFAGCKRRFKDASTRRKHSIRHYPERQFPCKICDRLFVRERRMQSHLKTHMAKVKKEECDYCGVRFYNKNYLSTHIQRKHGRKKQKYVCDLCGLVTSNKPSIVMHIKYGHGGDKELKCSICDKAFKKDVNLKLHYWMAHEMEYNMPAEIPARYKKKKKKSDAAQVAVKEEPIDNEYEGQRYFQVIPKIEPLDEEGLEELTNVVPEPEIRPEFEDLPADAFEDFITPVAKGHEDRRQKNVNEVHIDKKAEKRVKRKIENLMEEIRKKEREKDIELRKKKEERARKGASRALERTRRKYNKLIRNAIKNSLKKDKIKIKHGAISAQEQHPDSLLEENFSIKQTIDNRDCIVDAAVVEDIEERRTDTSEDEEMEDNTLIDDERHKNVENPIDNSNEKEVTDDIKEKEIDRNENELDIQENEINTKEDSEKFIDEDETSPGNREVRKNTSTKSGRNRKLKFNTHQCYVCFKLYPTKEELLEHCKEHFDQCNMQTLKKCPICDYTTNLSITTHLKRKHNITVKVPYGSFKDNKQKNETKYYYEVNDVRIKKVEIIPSIKNLNKRESCKIDKRNREKKNKDILKSKLVKKGKEWIVMKEKIKINFNDCLLPKFDKLERVESANIKGSYADRLKELYKLAKKHGQKMVFPCDGCDKICQSLAALRLHGRKHEDNPKPFKAKVWKHKIKGKNINKMKNSNKVTVNKANRTAQPKPVVNKHKCDKALIDFYNQNIKGSDIEFWQFLKIYNKMERENVNNFEDLQNSSHFGLHFYESAETSNDNLVNSNEPKVTNDLRIQNKNDNFKSKPIQKIKKGARDAFTRVVRLSKRELMKRNEAKGRLREKIKCNSESR